jgi:hypothetical protein
MTRMTRKETNEGKEQSNLQSKGKKKKKRKKYKIKQSVKRMRVIQRYDVFLKACF